MLQHREGAISWLRSHEKEGVIRDGYLRPSPTGLVTADSLATLFLHSFDILLCNSRTRSELNAYKAVMTDAGVGLGPHRSPGAYGLLSPLKHCSCNDSMKNESCPSPSAS